MALKEDKATVSAEWTESQRAAGDKGRDGERSKQAEGSGGVCTDQRCVSPVVSALLLAFMGANTPQRNLD